jgi:hypothetical protein
MLNEIGALRNEIGQLRTEMHEMETRLRLGIQSEGNKLRAELHKEIAALRGDVGNIAWKVAGLWSSRPSSSSPWSSCSPISEPRRRRRRVTPPEA